jgi:hypothetical protein
MIFIEGIELVQLQNADFASIRTIGSDPQALSIGWRPGSKYPSPSIPS